MTTFRPDLFDKVQNGDKTQTRRPLVPGDILKTEPLRVYRETKRATMRLHWQVGKSYAVQPGRGKEGVGRIVLTNIRFEDVREISLEDAKAEGFETVLDFLAVWVGFYDPRVSLEKLDEGRWRLRIDTPARSVRTSRVKMRVDSMTTEITGNNLVLSELKKRPANLYKAWALTFKLVVPISKAVAS